MASGGTLAEPPRGALILWYFPQRNRLVLAGGQGHDADVGGRLVHGGVLLGLVGQMVCLNCLHHQDTPPPFELPYTTFGYTS